jgi:RNA polymerase sigma-70 factor (ECF subfamily)
MTTRAHVVPLRAPKVPLADAALAAGALDGHGWAAVEVWDRYASMIHGTVRRALGPGVDVEDIVQEVFATYFQKPEALRDPSALSSFLVGIALRLTRAELRRRRVKHWLRLTRTGSLPERDHAPDAMELRDAVRRLYRLLDEVDDQSRLAFVLRYVEGQELEDVGAALGLSLATVKRRIERVTQRLATLVEHDSVLLSYVTRRFSTGPKGGQSA